MKASRLTRLALLTALSLILFTIELQLPNPTPIAGIKLGLANIVTVFAAYRFRPYETFLMLLCRIIIGSLIAGNPSAVIYSFAGGMFCLAGILPLRKIIPENRIFVCGIIGAILHNVGQIAVASLIFQSAYIWYYLPVLVLSGAAAGAFTGICAQLIIKRFNKRK